MKIKEFIILFCLIICLRTSAQDNSRYEKYVRCNQFFKNVNDSLSTKNALFRDSLIERIFSKKGECLNQLVRFLSDYHSEFDSSEVILIRDSMRNGSIGGHYKDNLELMSIYGFREFKYEVLKDNELIKDDILYDYVKTKGINTVENKFLFFEKISKIRPFVLLAINGDEKYDSLVQIVFENMYEIITSDYIRNENQDFDTKLMAFHLFGGKVLPMCSRFYSKRISLLYLDLIDVTYDFNAYWKYDDVGIPTSTSNYIDNFLSLNPIYPLTFRKKWVERFSPYRDTYEGKDMEKLDELIAQFKKEALAILEANDED